MWFIILQNKKRGWVLHTSNGKYIYATLSMAKRTVADAKKRYGGNYHIIDVQSVGEWLEMLARNKKRWINQIDLESQAGKRPRGDG